mgnify:FL=1
MEERNFVVYKHASPNGKVYIGITCQDIQARWKNGYGYTNNKHFYNAINKYGWDNIEHEILFNNLTEEEAKLMEQMYIALYDTTNSKHGYNHTLGGDGTLGHKVTEETRRKISQSQIGRAAWNKGKKGMNLSEEHRLKISKKIKGRILSEEHRLKISKSHKGLKHTELTKNKLSVIKKGQVSPRKGISLSEETKQKISQSKRGKCKGKEVHNAKQVICLTTNEVFEYINQAQEVYKTKNISNCCKGKRKHSGKLPDGTPLKWMYYEDYLKLNNKKEIVK